MAHFLLYFQQHNALKTKFSALQCLTILSLQKFTRRLLLYVGIFKYFDLNFLRFKASVI
jgi:hypothetical protein